MLGHDCVPMSSTSARISAFGTRFGLRVPILLAPMVGVSAPSLSIAVANAGGLGACGVLLMAAEICAPRRIVSAWCRGFALLPSAEEIPLIRKCS